MVETGETSKPHFPSRIPSHGEDTQFPAKAPEGFFEKTMHVALVVPGFRQTGALGQTDTCSRTSRQAPRPHPPDNPRLLLLATECRQSENHIDARPGERADRRAAV